MAELEFSRNVPDVPASAGGAAPTPYHRTAGYDVTPFPEFQGAMTHYADASNWMSSIGSRVASMASNSIAQQIGGELGKNPHGNLGPVVTDFDKTMQETYNTQAQATLGLQANKLINDSYIQSAKMTRITPGVIDKADKSITAGLQSILKNAPSNIAPHLEYQFGSAMMEQRSTLTNRMIREQKEDQRNNNAYASDMNTQHAYSFGLGGNDKAGLAAIENTKKLNEASVAARLITPENAKSNIDAARKSYLSGKMINGYENAKANGKGEAYLKSIADKKPGDISDQDYMPVTNNLMAYVNHQDALRSQDQSLRVTKFATSVAMNPMAPDMAQQLQDLKNNVSPEAFEKAQLHYITAVKKFNTQTSETNSAVASWNDPSSFARLPAKSVNQGFDNLVTQYQQTHAQQGQPMSREEAEVQIAASAGGKVPVFVQTLKNKINSGNPVMMDAASAQINALYSMNASHAIQGLSEQDKAIFTQFKSLRDALPPEEASKIAIQNSNQDPDTQKMNKEKWSAFIKGQTGGLFGTSPTDFVLKQADLDKKEFMNPGVANEYGRILLNQYSAYFQMTNGDQKSALELVKQQAKENFGYTSVNGEKTMTLHPIEKVLGHGDNSDVVPFIHQDMASQLNTAFTRPSAQIDNKMVSMKEAFDAKKTNEYWEVVPNDMKDHAHFFGHDYEPVKIKRYIRTGSGIKTDTYPVSVIGNSFNWDIAVHTESGMRPLMQIAPYLGIHTYTPNQKAINEAYLKAHGSK